MSSPARLTLVSLAVLAVAACQRPAGTEAEPTAPAATPATPAAPAAAPADQTTNQAFRAAWGHAPPFTTALLGLEDRGDFTFEDSRLVPLDDANYALVSSGTGPYDSHATSGALAIHYLERSPDGFRRLSTPPLFIEDGQYGGPPNWSVREGILAAPTLVTDSFGSGQGYSCGSAILIELTPDRPIIRADRVRLAFSNEGAAEDPKDIATMEGRILPGTPGREFVVQYSGASEARVIWRIGADGLYRPTNEPDDLPWC